MAVDTNFSFGWEKDNRQKLSVAGPPQHECHGPRCSACFSLGLHLFARPGEVPHPFQHQQFLKQMLLKMAATNGLHSMVTGV